VKRRLATGVLVALVGWILAGAVAADPPAGQALPPALERSVDAEFRPGVPTDDLLFVLAIGSDARPRESVTRSRADSIHVIGVNPRKGRAAILGIPRDSYVPIPGAGSQKINAALFHGGPEILVRTVEQLTGIRIDAYMLTGFLDFRRMVTKVGPIEIVVPYPMSDAASGAHFRAGRTRMTGPRALAFARNRHDAPGGDFGRSLNQGRLLVAALRALREDVRKDPLALFRWTAAGFGHVRTDLSLIEMLELLQAAVTIDPSRVANRVVSGGGGFVGGASVVRLSSAAQAAFRDLRRDGLLGGPPRG
jgi:polyisoprenyl-teichoic acid--peptidoglycan teichoic acid transferase